MPHLQHPQTKEVLESQTNHEEMMDLVLQLNDAPATVIPIVTTTVPSTLVASLAPTAPMATTLPTSTPTRSATRSTTTGSTGDEANNLVKAMEEMSIQTTEMNRLKEKVTSLETD